MSISAELLHSICSVAESILSFSNDGWGHSDRAFKSEDLANLNSAGRVVVMDHHEPFVWHMVKLVVEMPSMLDLPIKGATTLNVYVRSLLGEQIVIIPVMYDDGGLL